VARTVGPVFKDIAVANAVNFSAYPSGGGSGEDCRAAEDVETCAIYASDCVGGCTGAAVQKITAFFSCFEAGWKENSCLGGDSKAAKCLKSSGINHTKHAKCKSDSGLIKQLTAKFHKVGKDRKVSRFPACYLDGKDVQMSSFDPQSLRKALCGVGVNAACLSGPSPATPSVPWATPTETMLV